MHGSRLLRPPFRHLSKGARGEAQDNQQALCSPTGCGFSPSRVMPAYRESRGPLATPHGLLLARAPLLRPRGWGEFIEFQGRSAVYVKPYRNDWIRPEAAEPRSSISDGRGPNNGIYAVDQE